MKKLLLTLLSLILIFLAYNLGYYIENEEIYNNRFVVDSQRMNKIIQDLKLSGVTIRRGSKGQAFLQANLDQQNYDALKAAVEEEFGKRSENLNLLHSDNKKQLYKVTRKKTPAGSAGVFEDCNHF
jgi:hypothetical protein